MRRFERARLAVSVSAIAVGALLVACTNTVTGTAEVNQEELALYTSEVRASSVAASSSRAAAADRAAEAACSTFRTSNSELITTFNAYIAAANDNAPDVSTKADQAAGALRNSAQHIDRKLTAEVPSAVSVPLRAYRDDSKTLADMVERDAPVDTMNPQIDKFNATRETAIGACEDY
ncbi:hypothetical protein [Nocardia donostiensis]|uniref:Lipoprotein n=1 Tax=Nocardia donostiensis TaxID=1538463 RepID=A0A1V2TM15_9NOCA|nr:hypothetical protein [Nocardia donostiensis]ONM50580.1 hypothetical protein B0T46_01350 [Nocardia donostiensis]OQS17187.1 hypothetical protein B0T36_00820 [Nocardia donostiensis]OQS20775.1 hypothetical protein B0T44_09115 [Nocardia donostiensis]